MLYFQSDYTDCACEQILERITRENHVKRSGYGTDDACESARKKIKQACNSQDAQVHFLMGGTQTNAIVLNTLMSPIGGVMCADTGHINVHEAGAIEASGHKVIALKGDAHGKLSAQSADAYMQNFYGDETHMHMTRPEVIYISQPTEQGSVYTKSELLALRSVCDKYDMRLFVDGARLGYALVAQGNDVTLPLLAQTCDAFYIGGTKVGALFGEAVVFKNSAICKDFFSIMKQRGALLAKGFLLGLQFDTLFTDGLYERIAANAVSLADELRQTLLQKGYTLFCENTTNQIFITVPNEVHRRLSEHAVLQVWEKPDAEHTTLRIATSWATTKEQVQQLKEIL